MPRTLAAVVPLHFRVMNTRLLAVTVVTDVPKMIQLAPPES